MSGRGSVSTKGSHSAGFHLNRKLKEAAFLHRSGLLAEAEAAYKKILRVIPDHADVLSLLGLAIFQRGKHAAAAVFVQKAIRIDPSNPSYHINLGNILSKFEYENEAADSYRQALMIQPNNTEALNNLGNVYYVQDKMDEAVSCYKKAIELKPENPGTRSNLGNALRKLGRLDEAIYYYRNAIAANPNRPDVYVKLGNMFAYKGDNENGVLNYKKAIELKPDGSDAHNNLGNILKQQGDTEAAISCYRKSLDLEPDHKDALNNLANALNCRGKVNEAIDCYRKALIIDAEYPEAYNNLGNALNSHGKTDEAVLSFQKAIMLNPDNFKAYNNLGSALRKQGRLAEAVKAFKKSMEMEPGYAEGCSNMAGTLLKQGKVTEAIEGYKRVLAIQPDYAAAHSNLLFACNYEDHHDPKWLFSQHLHWDAVHSLANRYDRLHSPRVSPQDGKLRIGYVSPDFRTHSVAYFLKGIIEAHDRSGFEVFCYSDVTSPDEVTRSFARDADCFANIAGLDNKTVAGRIRQDKIDILVDLAGHTAGNRLPLFSIKPAPIQVAYIGYPNTTGLEAMDYRLTDALADPPGQTDHLYTEKLVRMPSCFLCYTPSEKSPVIGKRREMSSGRIVFGSFNNRAKITQEVIKTWAKILTHVPNSLLILKSASFADPETRENLLSFFFQNDIGPDRIELLSNIPSMFDHLQLYNRIDIGLDTFPYNGATTTCEALWMGVPVITLAGRTHRSRVGASLLTNAGLGEFVTESVRAYVKEVINLAGNREKLKSIQNGLRSRMIGAPLMDVGRFIRLLDGAYRWMFNEWLESFDTMSNY